VVRASYLSLVRKERRQLVENLLINVVATAIVAALANLVGWLWAPDHLLTLAEWVFAASTVAALIVTAVAIAVIRCRPLLEAAALLLALAHMTATPGAVTVLIEHRGVPHAVVVAYLVIASVICLGIASTLPQRPVQQALRARMAR
jgi:hypothetical protein